VTILVTWAGSCSTTSRCQRRPPQDPAVRGKQNRGIMKRVLFVSAAMLVLAGSAEARIFSQDDCDECCLISAQLLRPGEDDDAEVWRPGLREDDDEAIEAMPPGLREDDDEDGVPGRPGVPSDEDDDE
jgi:hypothetical protein